MKTNYINLLKLTLIVAAMVAIAVTVIGILATPVVLAVNFSWYWLFLYLGYLLVALYIVVCIDTKVGGTRK